MIKETQAKCFRYKYQIFLVPVSLGVAVGIAFLFFFSKGETKNIEYKLVIDQDGGADDAMAIFMALLSEQYLNGPEVVALTTVFGNVNESQVFTNTQRILNIAQRKEIPIYRGCSSAFIKSIMSDYFFGFDGLGDNEVENYELLPAEPTHAALALIELSKLYEGQLIVVAIGSLTNIGLAIKLDPDFRKRLAQLYIGAGHIYGDEFKDAEFNAAMDAEAYHMAVNGSNPEDLTIVPYSPVRTDMKIENDWRINVLGAIPTEIMKYMNKFERISIPAAPVWSILDPAVMAVVLHQSIVDEWRTALSSIILCGKDRAVTPHNFSSENPNSRVTVAFNVDEYKKFLYAVFSAPIRNNNDN